MRAIKILVIFFVIVIAGIFGAHNSDYVKVDMFPFPLVMQIKFFIVPLLSCIAGIILGGVYASAKASYWKAKYKRLLKKNDVAS